MQEGKLQREALEDGLRPWEKPPPERNNVVPLTHFSFGYRPFNSPVLKNLSLTKPISRDSIEPYLEKADYGGSLAYGASVLDLSPSKFEFSALKSPARNPAFEAPSSKNEKENTSVFRRHRIRTQRFRILFSALFLVCCVVVGLAFLYLILPQVVHSWLGMDDEPSNDISGNPRGDEKIPLNSLH